MRHTVTLINRQVHRSCGGADAWTDCTASITCGALMQDNRIRYGWRGIVCKVDADPVDSHTSINWTILINFNRMHTWLICAAHPIRAQFVAETAQMIIIPT